MLCRQVLGHLQQTVKGLLFFRLLDQFCKERTEHIGAVVPQLNCNFVDAVKKLHDCIEKVAAALGQDSTDVFRALLAKLIEQPEEKQTFGRLLEMAEKFAAKHE